MSENSKDKLLCYNKGCGQSFQASKNTPESCIHHPGIPVFHDAYKKWSCCDKKTTDFTEFLNIKGCAKSYHSNVKPPEAPKQTENVDEVNKDEIYTYRAPQPIKPIELTERPDANAPMKRIKATIGSSLKSVLEKMQKVIIEDLNDENASHVALKTPCKNGGCKEVYKGEHTNEQLCWHHPGVPVFHEGLKFWTCCVKRTTDFDSFLEQIGCTTGNHVWHKKKNPENDTSCRYDWHQTANSVVISIYSKCPIPDLSYVEVNPVKLHLHIVFGNDKSLFNTEILLFGVIDTDNSFVTYLGSKVEINLKKMEPLIWGDLAICKKSIDACDLKNVNPDIDLIEKN